MVPVSDEPVGGVVFLSPSDDSDAVASKSASRSVNVDTGCVVDEIFVDSEASFEWSAVRELSLHQGSSLVSRDRVDLAGLVSGFV